MKQPARYRAVIFDFGGVISTPPLQGLRLFCESTGISLDALRQLFSAPDGAWARFEMNRLSQEEFVRAFEAEASALGYPLDGNAFLQAFFDGMAVRPDMLAVVRALRGRYKLGCITNNVRGGHRNPLLDELFDVVVESSKEGLRKPDPRIYQIACERLGVRPEEAIFLDDIGANLKPARALGMATIKVDETTSAIDELERLLGIPLPRESGDPIPLARVPE
jgi:putative hydrolase of the HAD superfamily